LLEVQGIDVYFVGPTDLSNSLGQPGVFDSKLQNIVESAIGRIIGAGKVAGIITTDPRAARNYIELGVRYLVTHATHFMTKGAKLFLAALKTEE
jgi:2-keto-3-deoxy-L-rhamnonate aldolase RhmA